MSLGTAVDSAKLEYLFKHDYALLASDRFGASLKVHVHEDRVVFIKRVPSEEFVSTIVYLLDSIREFEVSDGVTGYLAKKINDHKGIPVYNVMAATAIDLMLGRRFFDETMMREATGASITLESMKKFKHQFVSTAVIEALIWGKMPMSVVHDTFNLLSSYSSAQANVEPSSSIPWTLPPAQSSIRYVSLSPDSNAMHVLLLIDREENPRNGEIAGFYGKLLDEIIEEHRRSANYYYFQNVRVLLFNRHTALSILIIGEYDNHDAKERLEKLFVRSQQVILQMRKDEFRKRYESFKEASEEFTFMGQLIRKVFGVLEPSEENSQLPISKREMMRFMDKYILTSGSHRREICLQSWDDRQYAHRLDYIRNQNNIPIAASLDDVAAYLRGDDTY